MVKTIITAILFATLASTKLPGTNICEAAENPIINDSQRTLVKITLDAGGKTLTATLASSKAAKDFLSLLPLKLTFEDLFGREKFAHLPRPLSEEGKRSRKYEVGTIAYWPPGPDVAIFYRDDGLEIPAPGIILLGKIESGVETLGELPSPIKMTFDLQGKTTD